ncbi:unnamed protein product [Chrysodeixis includens]|uniref:AB hydrolase-1 domain-containing protein n=1 Tax=Chrysodeixis includens TaxID=689277 RepID=A0A9P0BVT4_CHRIL|nr:unnamed protein product [Chrysodeixis includens]
MKLTRQLWQFTAAIKSMMQLPEKELTIKAPWGNLAALTWGDPSNPPVLLCHGKLDVCTGFRPLVSRLPPSFYYVTVDLPGNGRSEHFAKGVRFTVMDFVPTIVTVVKHFKWEKFIYIGHSLGVPIGKFFNMAYPGYITRVVEIDPVPAHHTWPLTREGMHDWYHSYYGMYNPKKFVKFNSGVETAPRYTYEKAPAAHDADSEVCLKRRQSTSWREVS